MVDRRRVLIVDDEASIRESLSLLLKSSFDVEIAPNGRQAIEDFDRFNPDLVLLDVMMPELDGLETLKCLRDKGSQVPVLMLSAVGTVKTAVQAMKFGAVDYLNKPFDVAELTSLIVKTLDSKNEVTLEDKKDLDTRTPEKANEAQQATPAVNGDFGCMVGKSPLMLKVFERISQCAPHDSTVLITGESGTGKELVARELHERSTRSSGPFIAINCAAIPESLIEAELFGHEKGSFTHAIERRIGHFEMADNGTLFLDEIGELSLGMQVKLLRFLQLKEFQRIGKPTPIKVNVRVVVATNRDLEQMVKEGSFRQDLYYRINVIGIEMPALKDRFEDILHLVDFFSDKFCSAYSNRKLSFSDAAKSAIVEYGWPGNVRELENFVESLLALSVKDDIDFDDLPAKLTRKPTEIIFRDSTSNFLPAGLNFQAEEKRFESEMILKALRKTGYVQTRAAELLGISRRILKYKMDKLGISEKAELS
jgi:DNA-binding NtrC family response regulator